MVADALSRKAVIETIVSSASSGIIETIKEGMQHDPVGKQLLNLPNQGKTQRFWEEDGNLYTTGKRVYVPKWANLRHTLLKEGHDTAWAGHLGQKRMLALIESSYYWPRMREDIETERINTLLECYLRHYINANQRDWAKLLDIV
ncbi:uncharacterized protein LOC142172407 [Nicotiana tabacum]|uniref:Uncharacterized protein LOC142172407 n=1 Tax=Nicotiana tabacum TaxID=4097 RepID=A0AC58T4F2_TOBAC